MRLSLSLPHSRRGLTLLEVVVVILILGVLATCCVPAILHSREISRRNLCKDRLKQLGVALHNYHDTHKIFPYASTYGVEIPTGADLSTNGHNWIGLLLPFIEQAELSKKLDFHVGYQDPENWRILEPIQISLLGCPSNSLSALGRPVYDPKSAYNPTSFTGIPNEAVSQGLDYALCAGSTCPGTMPPDVPPERNVISSANNSANSTNSGYLFDPANGNTVCPDSVPVDGVPVSWYRAHTTPRTIPGMFTRGITRFGIRDCPDGTSNVIMAGERLSQEIVEGAVWSHNAPVAHTSMRPNSMNRAPGSVNIFAMNGGYASQHENGSHVLLVDGTVQFVSKNIERMTYFRLGDRNDGATLDTFVCGSKSSHKEHGTRPGNPEHPASTGTIPDEQLAD